MHGRRLTQITLLFIFLTGFVSSSNLWANQTNNAWYLNADAGFAFQQDVNWQGRAFSGQWVSVPAKFHPGYRVDLGVGRQFTNGMSLELEAAVIENSISNPSRVFVNPVTVDLYQIPLLLNGIYTFDQWKGLRPYLGVGAGSSISILDGRAFPSESAAVHNVRYDTTIALQALAGVHYKINPKFDVDFTYKCLYAQEYTWQLDVNNSRIASLVNHQLALGMTYHF